MNSKINKREGGNMRRASVLLAMALLGLLAVGCGSDLVTLTPAAPAELSVANEPPAAEATSVAAEVESASAVEGANPPAAEVTPTVAVDAVSASVLASADLTAFVEAWNSGEVDAIRAFYADGAAYLSDKQVVALQRKELVSVLIADEAFADRVREHEGLRMRILGEPIQVYDKLVGFAFRWEGDSKGYDSSSRSWKASIVSNDSPQPSAMPRTSSSRSGVHFWMALTKSVRWRNRWTT